MADNNDLLIEMGAAVKLASDQWEEVCRVYTDAWDTAFESWRTTLQDIATTKKARAEAVAARLSLCIDLAAVLLPVIGGEIAIVIAPVASVKTLIFADDMAKRAAKHWTIFALSRPITAKALEFAEKQVKGQAKSLLESERQKIVDKLSPSPQVQALSPATKPVDAFIDKNHLMREAMDQVVKHCAAWNLAGGFLSYLVPDAHQILMNHPWIKRAPSVTVTQGNRYALGNLIEMVLWLKWAAGRNQEYWGKIHDWYVKEYLIQDRWNGYSPRSGEGRRDQSRSHFDWVDDALDHRGILARIAAIGGASGDVKMALIAPDSKWSFDDIPTVDISKLREIAHDQIQTAHFLSPLTHRLASHHSLAIRQLFKMISE